MVSILSGKNCVNKLSLHLGILFASDGPIFTKKLLKPLAIVLSPVIFDSSPLNSVLICFPFDFLLNKLRSFLPSGVLQTIYNTLILPHMIYGILALGRHTKVIHTIQKRATRIVAASKYNAHTEPLSKS